MTENIVTDGTVGLQPATSRDTSISQRSSQRFDRSRRILKTDEYSSVFRLRPTCRSAHFVLYARPAASAMAQARLGVVVAKRLAPRSVTRNLIKRQARELFRLALLPAADCVVRLSAAVAPKSGPASSALLKKTLRLELQGLLAQLVSRFPKIAGSDASGVSVASVTDADVGRSPS